MGCKICGKGSCASSFHSAEEQEEHEKWNNTNCPGTKEICCKCDEPTGNCEDDNIVDDEGNAYCYDCAIGAGLLEVETGN